MEISNVSTNSIKGREKRRNERAEKIRQDAANKQAAENLINELNGNSNHIEATAVKKYVKAELKDQYKNGDIDKAEYKNAKKIAKSRDYKKELNEKEKEYASNLVAGTAKYSDGLNVRAVRKDVKNGLEMRYDKDSEEYKVAKDYATKGSIFGRFFDKKSDGRVMMEAKAKQNEVQKVKTEGPKFNKKQQALLDAAGYTAEDVYKMGDAAGGKYDGTINYSYKKDENQINKAVDLFNNNENNVEFSRHKTKRILRKAGYDVENAVSAGKLLKHTLWGAAAGALVPPIKASQTQNTVLDGMGHVENIQSTTVKGLGIPFGAVAAATGSVVSQIKRYHDGTSEELGEKVYNEPRKAMKLNPEEILPKAEVYAELSERSQDSITVINNGGIKTGNYTVERQYETWYELAKARYGAKTDDEAKAIVRVLKDRTFDALKAAGKLPEGVEKSTDAFFLKVGDSMQVPLEIKIGNKTYKYDETKQVGIGTNGDCTSIEGVSLSGEEYLVRTTGGHENEGQTAFQVKFDNKEAAEQNVQGMLEEKRTIYGETPEKDKTQNKYNKDVSYVNQK